MTFQKRTHQLICSHFTQFADYLMMIQQSDGRDVTLSPLTIAEVEIKLKPIHEKHQIPLSYASGKWRLKWDSNADKQVDALTVVDALEYMFSNVTSCLHNQKQLEQDLYPIAADLVETFSEQLKHDTKKLGRENARQYMARQFQSFAVMALGREIENSKLNLATNRCVNGYNGMFDNLPYCFATTLITAHAHVKAEQWARRQKNNQA